MTIGTIPVCMKCVHYDEAVQTKNSCTAFPDGIPDEIFVHGNIHSEPLSGQGNDVVFEEEVTQ